MWNPRIQRAHSSLFGREVKQRRNHCQYKVTSVKSCIAVGNLNMGQLRELWNPVGQPQ
jgi:hypothetical protein